MKAIYSLPFKMTISAAMALMIANYIDLSFGAVAAVIAILSIQDTRKKAIAVGKNRIIACIIGQVLSVILYGVLGNSAWIFGIFLIIFIPLTSRLNIEEGMVPAVVLSTHLLSVDSITLSLIGNELLIMIIGIGVASIANIFMPSLEDIFNEDKKYIEESYRTIISRMAKSLVTHTVDIDEQRLMTELEQKLEESKNRAYKIVNDSFFQSNLYYTDYMNMRINQFDVLKRMRLHFERFYMSFNQTVLMSEFTKKISKNVRETNDCKKLLEELEVLQCEFKKMELPKSREEFENRALLFQYLNDLEELLTIKRNFALNYLE